MIERVVSWLRTRRMLRWWGLSPYADKDVLGRLDPPPAPLAEHPRIPASRPTPQDLARIRVLERQMELLRLAARREGEEFQRQMDGKP